MAECNRHPIPGNNNNRGNGIAVPFDRGDGVDDDHGHGYGHGYGHGFGHGHSDNDNDNGGGGNGRIPSHRSEQRESNQGYPRRPPQQQTTNGNRNRGYRTVTDHRPPPSRWDQTNNRERQRGEDIGHDDHVRSRRGTAAGSWHRNNHSMVR
jgi:hypothetical protein